MTTRAATTQVYGIRVQVISADLVQNGLWTTGGMWCIEQFRGASEPAKSGQVTQPRTANSAEELSLILKHFVDSNGKFNHLQDGMCRTLNNALCIHDYPFWVSYL